MSYRPLHVLPWLALLSPLAAQAADSDIRLSSIGYVPDRAKRASVVATATEFDVKNDADGAVAMHGTLTGPVLNGESGESIMIADFTSLTTEGVFYVEVPGVGRSVSFPVSKSAFEDPFRAMMIGYYGWRCNTALSFVFAGQRYSHYACHMTDAHTDYLGSPGLRDGKKGWHDAGDYGKYTINAGVTVGGMLHAFEQFPDALSKIVLALPERTNTIPDYLDEIRWELEWLLTMPYSATDARISHKLTSLEFDAPNRGWVMPEKDTQTRYFVPYSSAATALFIAMMAKAARVYRPYDDAFAQKCLDAATVSYAYLVANTANVNPSQAAFHTGAYTTNDSDDRIWAAAEMWETTGDAAALADFETRIGAARTPKVAYNFDWGTVTNLGVFTYLRSKRAGRNATTVATLEAAATSAADTLVRNAAGHGYGRGLGQYYWGANGSVARSCMVLFAAHEVLPNPAYVDTCIDQIAWLFGRNAYDRSFVTGVGRDPPMHPHHRPSEADGIVAPWPGLLVGGGRTATDWVDDWTNYEVNEVCINWNGALVYALAPFLDAATLHVPPLDDDAGLPTDAEAPPVDDATVFGDDEAAAPATQETGVVEAGPTPTEISPLGESGGCGCRVATRTHASTAWALALLGVVTAACRRRSRSDT